MTRWAARSVPEKDGSHGPCFPGRAEGTGPAGENALCWNQTGVPPEPCGTCPMVRREGCCGETGDHHRRGARDGTVNEIARAMIHSNAILGIIPKGSGNGLARELHIPMDVKRAIDLIAKGHVTTIDCCRANGQVFFCTCGVGFDAAVSQKFANEKRRGSLTYIKNTIEEYLSYKPEPYELVVDNQTIKEKAFLVACANASQYGNNAFIAPHANIQDGRMDVTILSPFMPLDIAPLAIQLFTKQIDRNSKIKTMKAQQVTIIRQHPGVMHLDGEPIMADRRIDITVEPKALHVLTPEVVSFTKEVHNLFDEVTRFFDKKLPYIFK